MAGNLSGNLNGIVQFLSFDLCAKLRIFSEIHKKKDAKIAFDILIFVFIHHSDDAFASFEDLSYQSSKRSDSGMKSLSPFFTPNASYHALM